MANCCSYKACVKGKPDIVDKVVKYIADHSYDGDPEIEVDYPYDEELGVRIKIVTLNGVCKWSVFTAFNLEKYSPLYTIYETEKYDDPDTKWMIDTANEIHKQHVESPSILDIRGDNDDDYTIEIFSEESGMGFAEHYILSAGKIILDECRDFYEVFDEKTETTMLTGGFIYLDFTFDPTHVIPEYKEFTVKD